ncbi:gustatory receptor 68a-like [Trichogramma pretiosum]|uniref:gustatory receptor 68a-like n=1 Tax=Trichogramma pretiosum TaxID=7493 RepID=UPI0006C9AF27|nr:gustatory receptor 68a-like [Trichogramma pretiosum]
MRLLPRTAVEKPLYLTYLVNWLCGIGVIEYPMGRPRPWLSFGYSGGCLVVYCTLAVLAAPELAHCFPAEMLLPTTILFYSHIVLTVSTIVLGWLRSEGMRACILNLAATDSLMDRFEATSKNYSRVAPCRMLEIVARLAMVLFIMILSSYLFYEEDTPSRTRVLVSVVLSYPVMLMFVADTTFINIVNCVTYRFRNLNDLLENMLSESNEFRRSDRSKRSFEEKYTKWNMNISESAKKDQWNNIKLAKKIHLALVNICQEADRSYGLQIILSSVVAFAIITGNMYVNYLVLVELHLPRQIMMKSIIGGAIWIAYYTLKIRCFSCVCTRCVEQSVTIGDIVNKFYDDPVIQLETQAEIRDFNIQMIQQPLKFTACGFLTIDFTLVQGMTATITTYLMVMVQLRKSSTSYAMMNAINSTK